MIIKVLPSVTMTIGALPSAGPKISDGGGDTNGLGAGSPVCPGLGVAAGPSRVWLRLLKSRLKKFIFPPLPLNSPAPDPERMEDFLVARGFDGDDDRGHVAFDVAGDIPGDLSGR
jgi:hypothetical protein